MLKAVDKRATRRVSGYAANSSTVRDRIRRFWRRDAEIIHPPVRVDFFNAGAENADVENYVLGVGRWVRYKNLHRVIDVANLVGMPVKIAGRGPDRDVLHSVASRASVPVEIIESPTEQELRTLYQNAACLVFPTVEDFGIVPVEAQAAGTPVVAPRAGGVLDTVTDGVTGYLVDGENAETLAQAVKLARDLDRLSCIRNSRRFSQPVFERNFGAWVRSCVSERAGGNGLRSGA